MSLKNKYVFTSSFFAFLVLVLVSCEKDNKITPPAPLSEFPTPTSVGKYFVTNNANTVFNIPVGITNVSDKDRTVNFTVSSPTGAVEGQQYTLGMTSIIIPAGSPVANIPLKGIFAGYPTGRKDTLVFTISGGDVSPFTGYNVYKVVMQKYCDVVLANLEGDYTQTYENGTYGPYTTTISNAVSTGATKATVLLSNIYDSGIDAPLNLDWTDPSNFSVSMPSTDIGGGYFVRTSASGTKTFSSCDNTFTVALEIYSSAGVYDAWIMTMAR